MNIIKSILIRSTEKELYGISTFNDTDCECICRLIAENGFVAPAPRLYTIL